MFQKISLKILYVDSVTFFPERFYVQILDVIKLHVHA